VRIDPIVVELLLGRCSVGPYFQFEVQRRKKKIEFWILAFEKHILVSVTTDYQDDPAGAQQDSLKSHRLWGLSRTSATLSLSA
jgi:hypothetical protein